MKKQKTNDNIVRSLIAKNMELLTFSDDDMAIYLRCTKRTFQNKKKCPQTFNLKELRILCKTLHFSEEEKAQFLS